MLSIVRRFFTLIVVASLLAGTFVSTAGNVQAKAATIQDLGGKSGLVFKPALGAAASISLNGLGDVLIGENFSFTVAFKNSGSSVGYGPFVDLVFPTNGADGALNRSTPDGIDFLSATTLGYTFNAGQTTQVVQVFPGSGVVGCVDHPWAHQSDGKFLQVCGPAGDTLVSLRLPFGGVVPGQPIPSVTVKAHLSNYADVDVPLDVHVRGGFIYGNNPLDDWCCGDSAIVNYPTSSSPAWPSSPVVPKVFTFAKTYTGPDNLQDETSSGANYTRKYNLLVNIANGQKLTNLRVFDKLPDNEKYVSLDAGGTTPGYTVITTPAPALPGGILSLRYASATGTAADDDIKVIFNFYVPRLDAANAPVISPTSGTLALSKNIAWMTGDWVPADGRDAAESLASDDKCVTGGKCQPLHTLQDKSMAIQKTVTNLTDSKASPGDVFEYSLTFQISDYFAFDTVSVTDLISDGQHVDGSFAPTLQINGNGYNLAAATINAANLDISCNYTGGPGGECTANNPVADDGTTKFVVRISNEIITRGQNGRLIGGCINTTGGNIAGCTTGDGPTQGVITFRTIMQDAFTNNFPSGDASVDQGDELIDQATLNGRLLDNNTFAGGSMQSDDAGAAFSVPHDGLRKILYAINGDNNPSNWQRKNGDVLIKPNDDVTYRMTYNLSTSDVEDLKLEDYLPLPVFFVSDPDADDNTAHNNGPAFVFDDVVSAAAPAVGHAKFAAGDTFRAYSGIVPTLSTNSASNVLRFTYGDYDNPKNSPTTIDLLFTLTVSSEPFADQSFIANQAHEAEGSTNTGDFSQDALEWFILTQPALTTTKSVIWTSSPSAAIDPPTPITFLSPGSSPRWNGVINSNLLKTKPLNSDISGVRTGDIVSYAIVVENQGTSLKGAFDIVISDTMPDLFDIPAAGLNLQIHYGNGTGPIDTVVDGVVTQADCIGGWPGNPCGPDKQANTPDDIFGRGIKLVDPVGKGVCDAYNPNLGNNVIMLTYDLVVKQKLKTGVYTNIGKIGNYSSFSGGKNHVSGGIIWNLHTSDTAKASWIKATKLADTGFAPNVVTKLPVQPLNSAYKAMPGLWLEVPSLGTRLPIVGVPNLDDGWNLTWLANEIGYLQGTTPPTAVGNTVLTAHVYLADGSPGPFVHLNNLGWGETIILHADGYRYIYQVRSNQVVSPTNLTVFREDGYAWLTLLTCKDYSPVTKSYLYRVAVRAILLRVEAE